jgi:shikimate dehydrogenase
MKKFFVIGNPIEHSLSPTVHQHWFEKNNVKATYEKKLLEAKDLKNIIKDIKNDHVTGINVTVPFKQKIIPLLDELSIVAQSTLSVNTIYKNNNKVIGDNTDVGGFQKSLTDSISKESIKSALLIGAGGVAPSIVYALKTLGIEQIFITNRTVEKIVNLQEKFGPLLTKIVWEDLSKQQLNVDIIINATSLGLNNNHMVDLNFSSINKKKPIFYDVIYNPSETRLLQKAKKHGCHTINGMKMFLYQAQLAFEIWNQIKPAINVDLTNILAKKLYD